MSAHAPHIQRAGMDELEALQTISVRTFTETFAAYNTSEDMQQYLDQNFSRSRLLEELNTAGSSFYLMHSGAELAGYMKLNSGAAQTVTGKQYAIEIERIYVLQAFQGHKLGKTLLTHALSIAREKNYNSVWLGVWEHNTKAIGFYEHNGFVKTGSHEFILGSDVQTDYLMEKQLN